MVDSEYSTDNYKSSKRSIGAVIQMVDSEYSTDNYTSSTISFGAVIQNPEMRS